MWKLIDFGMSARFEAGVKMKERVGTPYTMAPEVLQEQYTEKARGMVAWRKLSGRRDHGIVTQEMEVICLSPCTRRDISSSNVTPCYDRPLYSDMISQLFLEAVGV